MANPKQRYPLIIPSEKEFRNWAKFIIDVAREEEALRVAEQHKRNRRREVYYVVACGCRQCRAENGGALVCLGFIHSSEEEARQDLTRYSAEHPSCFLATETIEAIDQAPRKKAKHRKAA